MRSRGTRVAIIGAGLISKSHLHAFATMPDSAEVVALVETDPERSEAARRRYPSIRLLSNLDAVLDGGDVDLIDVCTPPASHEDIVVAALRAGKFVVCEKPLAPTLEGIDRIQAVARSHPGRLATVHQFRTMPEIREMTHLRDEGRLGSLLFGLFTDFDRIVGGPIGAKSWWGEWGTAGGGVGMTQFIHRLDLMCLLFGRPVEVTAMMGTLAASIESEDSLSATVRFERGAIVGGSATMTAQRTGFRIDVIGTRGSVHYPWALHLQSDGGPDGAAERSTSRVLRAKTRTSLPARGLRRARRLLRLGGMAPTNHTVFLRSVVEAATAGRPLPVPPEEARRSVELCTAIYASAMSGVPTTLPLSSDSSLYRGLSAPDYRKARAEREAGAGVERTVSR